VECQGIHHLSVSLKRTGLKVNQNRVGQKRKALQGLQDLQQSLKAEPSKGVLAG